MPIIGESHEREQSAGLCTEVPAPGVAHMWMSWWQQTQCAEARDPALYQQNLTLNRLSLIINREYTQAAGWLTTAVSCAPRVKK
jgi:hypothetical protein